MATITAEAQLENPLGANLNGLQLYRFSVTGISQNDILETNVASAQEVAFRDDDPAGSGLSVGHIQGNSTVVFLANGTLGGSDHSGVLYLWAPR